MSLLEYNIASENRCVGCVLGWLRDERIGGRRNEYVEGAEEAEVAKSKTLQLLTQRIAKSRTIAVRLISTAMTGFYHTFVRPRAHRPLSMLKYDPIGRSFQQSESLEMWLGGCGKEEGRAVRVGRV